ncbi:Ethylene-responsive transcription factor CRF1 [Hordeum vulgare]|nr:Ethylene-responsive transcription factor CRF1 [Hordeum vulgare]
MLPLPLCLSRLTVALPRNFGLPRRPHTPLWHLLCRDRSGNMRLGLNTFNTTDEAACAYAAAAWCLNRPHRDMNFPEVMTRELPQRLAPPLQVVTEEDRRKNLRREHHLGIAEMDEHAMAEWRQ